MGKTITALRMLLLVASFGFWSIYSANASTQLALIPPPTADTFRIGLPGGGNIQTCINLGGAGRSIQNMQHCGTSAARLTVAVVNETCLNVTALSQTVSDTFCAKNCLTTGTCRDMVLIFNSVSRHPPCGAISSRSLININLTNCAALGCYCLADSIDINDLKTNYAITDNGISYTGGYKGCNFDTIYSYTYFTVPNMGMRGPYRLDSWRLNGADRRLASFNTMQQLVDSMNVWDPIGNWQLDSTVFSISGGSTRNAYGQMKVTRLANRAVGILELNLGIVSNGIQMCFSTGGHQVIFTNNVSGCADTITVRVICSDTTTTQKPRAVDDIATTTTNRAVTITALLNDTLNGPLTGPLSIITPPQRGTATVVNNQIVYTPETGFCGDQDILSYQICNALGCDTADVVITVNCEIGTRLTAIDDFISTTKNTTKRFTPLSNDTIVGGLLTLDMVSPARHGSIGFVGTDSLDYIPNIDYCGLDTMQYRICNNDFICDTATVYFTVTCDGTRPFAVNDDATTPKNTAVTVNVLANDLPNGALTRPVTVVNLPTHGSTTVQNNQIIYTPDLDFCGTETFTYQICTAVGCDTAQVTVNVTCPSILKPVAVDDAATTQKNQVTTISVLNNDTQNGDLTAPVRIISSPLRGSATVTNNQIIYTPQADFCGDSDVLTYEICNANGCDTAQVTVNVTCPTALKPIAVDDAATTQKNQATTIAVLNNDTQNGDLTAPVRIISNPTNGTARITNNQIIYTPQTDFCGGNDVLTYEICNANGCDTAQVTITVNCGIIAPTRLVAVTDRISTQKNISIRFRPIDNDTLVGTLLGIGSISLPRHGSIGFVGNDSLVYSPETDYCGLDTMEYRLCNTDFVCSIAFIYITVNCPSTIKPDAINDVATTQKNQATTISVLNNDVLNGVLTAPVKIIANPIRGTVTITNNQIIYTPQAEYCGGKDTLSYEICNAIGCDTAQVVITVNCDIITPTRLVAVDDRISTSKNISIRFRPINNDTIIGTLLGIGAISVPRHGSIGFIGNDSLVYSPNIDYCGLDTMEYRLCNTDFVCSTAFIYITVNCPNVLKPDAINDIATTKKNQATTIAVLTNDILNDTLSAPVKIISNPTRGTATVTNNQITYTPNRDTCGFNDTLTYSICNTEGCDTAQVTVTVSCDTTPPRRPDAVNDVATVKKNQSTTITVLVNDFLNGDLVAPVKLISNPTRGTATITNNQITYKPNLETCGFIDTFRYEICNAVGCDTALVTITVECDTTPPRLKPDAINDVSTTKKNQPKTILVLANDVLNGNLTTPVTIKSNPRHGTATVVNNQIIYTPNRDTCGFVDTLSYEICNVLGCDNAQVFITVTCDSTPPAPKLDAINDVSTTKRNQPVTIPVLANDILIGTLTGPVKIINNPTRGTASVLNNQIVYTPNRDTCGFDDILTYAICNTEGCDTAQVTVTVGCDTTKQLKPDAVNDAEATKKNVPVTIRVLANDVLNGSLTGPVKVLRNPIRGTFTLSNEQIIYTPKPESCGFNDTLTYEICNINGCDTAQVVVTVSCDTTDATLRPDAIDDAVTTRKNELVNIHVLANDVVNGIFVTVKVISNPRRGTTTVNRNNEIVYTPNRDTCGFNDTLRYEVCNFFGCDTAQVVVTVTCQLDPNQRRIVAVDDSIVTSKNTSISFRPTTNDTIRTRLMSLEFTKMPSNGRGSFRGLDTLVYTPNLDFCGFDTLEYRICDTSFICDTATVFITVPCLPIALDDSDSTKINTTKDISILANDTLNGVLTRPLSIVEQPTLGTVTVNGDGTVSYKPFAGACGTNDVFTYQICNAFGCDTAKVTMKVICDSTILNKLPVAEPDVVTTRKNTAIRITILANDTINGTVDSIKIISSPLFGTAILGTNHVITYTPDSCGFTDSLIYRICNRNGCDTALVTIKVPCDSIFRAPIAVNDTGKTTRNRSVLIGVVRNDSLFAAGLDTIYISKRPIRGSALVENGQIRYLPQTDSCGYRDTFSYAICTRGGCDTADVVVDVSCNEALAPIAEPDTARTKTGQRVTIAVTLNDSLRGADTFRITRLPSKGTAVFDTLNRLRYTPDTSFCGRDTLIYEICNRNGCDTALVTIVVDCAPPVALNDSAKTRYNQLVGIPITRNDTLNGTDSISVLRQPTRGIVTILADKTANYTPSPNFCGVDSFRYEICNRVGCDTATVYIEVSCGDTLIVFNAISPNGDGKNDGFYIRGIENYPENEVVVFNRWGNEVYRKKGYRNSEAWEGLWNGLSVPDGTYFYCIYLNDQNGTKKIGYLQIMK